MLKKIFSIENHNIHKVVTIAGVKIKLKSEKLKQKILLRDQEKEENLFKFRLNEILKISNNKELIVYFDHSLGGGTETYFYNQLSTLTNNSILCRIQYFLHNKSYKFTIYNDYNNIYEIKAIKFPILSKFIENLDFTKIILNNIVGYPQVKEILDLISNYKKNSPSTEVVMKGHDFYSICPEWTLLNYNNEYCNIKCSDTECLKCFDKFKLKCNDIKENFSIISWRKMWEDFFINTVDIIEVFSSSSQAIFSQAYPSIRNKIILNPHKIKPFPKYNIAVLGNIGIHKGAMILKDLVNYLEKHNIYDYQFIIIGNICSDIKSELITETGNYSRNDIPTILKNYNIDLILIPSIWHETFSYTTAEAIALNYPVACFNMGGQADQVRQYKKGKILSSFEPKIIEKEIKEFLQNIEYKEVNA